MQHRLTREQGRLSALSGTLDALSPLKVLSRGYAIVKKDGQVIKRASDVSPGDRVAIRLAEGPSLRKYWERLTIKSQPRK